MTVSKSIEENQDTAADLDADPASNIALLLQLDQWANGMMPKSSRRLSAVEEARVNVLLDLKNFLGRLSLAILAPGVTKSEPPKAEKKSGPMTVGEFFDCPTQNPDAPMFMFEVPVPAGSKRKLVISDVRVGLDWLVSEYGKPVTGWTVLRTNMTQADVVRTVQEAV